MPKPYCVELRERAVAAFDAGRLQTEVVQLFKLSLASLKRWLAQRRAGQSLAPKTYRPGPRGAFGSPEALAALHPFSGWLSLWRVAAMAKPPLGVLGANG